MLLLSLCGESLTELMLHSLRDVLLEVHELTMSAKNGVSNSLILSQFLTLSSKFCIVLLAQYQVYYFQSKRYSLARQLGRWD